MFRLSTGLLAAKVLSQDFPHTRLVTLNNPKALNSLDLDMVHDLHKLYVTAPAPKSSLYVLKGAGEKAFCAGGDVVSVTTNKPDGCARSFFYLEYQVDYHIMHLAAAQVALWNGYIMGGGVGVSLGSKYRVATERACFAMPETAIGMIPDVGASWFLPRMQHKGVGLFMGLSGYRVKGADLVHLGLATHFVPSERLAELETALCEINDAATVETVLRKYAVPAEALPPCTLESSLKFVDTAFALSPDNTVPKIIKAVEAAKGSDPLAKAAADAFPSFSPTALCLSLEVLKRGATLKTPAEAFRMEYCVAQRLCAENDFTEGVRALLVDKDKKPKWVPQSLGEVTKEAIEAYFRPTYPNQPVWDPTTPLPPA